MREMMLRGDGRIAAKDFETSWNFDGRPGTVSFYVLAAAADFTVDWGDGMTEHYSGLLPEKDGNRRILHDYGCGADDVIVKIRGTIDHWHVCEDSARFLRRVMSFGPVGLGPAAFRRCGFLTDFSRIDTPDGRKLHDMTEFLLDADNFDDSLDQWDVSRVTSMHSAFKGALKFSHPLDQWDVSRVTDMRGMFCCTEAFNQPLESWNVSNVRYMDEMFMDSYGFNQPLAAWDVSRVESMRGMFCGSTEFDQPLNAWNVSNVRHMDEMFMQSMKFNHPIDRWNVSRVETMDRMFKESKFNQSLESWDISHVKSMKGFILDAPRFNQIIESWGWDMNAIKEDI